jgi:hypothetical protein
VAHQALTAALLALLVACGGASTGPVTVPAPSKPPAAPFPEDPRPLQRFHSKRFKLSLPLPDGPTWRIDDHSGPALVATHAPTRSRVVVSLVREDQLVGRRECEKAARDEKLVPAGDMHTLEDAVAITQETFDTRVWVALQPGDGPDRPIVGHVFAFGGFLRKCLLFDFSTEVDSATDEPVLSQRLAYARARIFGGLTLDPFDAVPREPGPDVEPPPQPAQP